MKLDRAVRIDNKNGIRVSTGKSSMCIAFESFDRLLHAGFISWCGGWVLKLKNYE
jgi:hypothetical protein